MNLDTILQTLKTYITDNQLSKAAAAKEIGVTRVELSQWLAGGDRKPVADKAFQILKFLTKGKQPIMNTIQTDDGLEAVNKSILAKSSKNPATITYFQSALTDGSGFVPGLSGEESASSIVDLLQTIARSGNNDDVAAALRDLIQGLKRANSNTVPQASVNRNANGTTRERLVIRSSGERAQVVDSQSFSKNETGGNVLQLDTGSKTIDDAKKDAKKAYYERVKNSHKSVEQEVELKKGSLANLAGKTCRGSVSGTQNQSRRTLKLIASTCSGLQSAKLGSLARRAARRPSTT